MFLRFFAFFPFFSFLNIFLHLLFVHTFFCFSRCTWQIVWKFWCFLILHFSEFFEQRRKWAKFCKISIIHMIHIHVISMFSVSSAVLHLDWMKLQAAGNLNVLLPIANLKLLLKTDGGRCMLRLLSEKGRNSLMARDILYLTELWTAVMQVFDVPRKRKSIV